MDEDLITVYEARGHLEGEMIRAFLEANGIKAGVIQESAGLVYGLTVGSLGRVEIIVNKSDVSKAEELLAAYEDNRIDKPSDDLEEQDSKGD
jgi:hypothetical protein